MALARQRHLGSQISAGRVQNRRTFRLEGKGSAPELSDSNTSQNRATDRATISSMSKRTVSPDPRRVVTLREWQEHWQVSRALAQQWLHRGQLVEAYRSPDTAHGTWLLRLDVRPPAPVRRQPTPRELHMAIDV